MFLDQPGVAPIRALLADPQVTEILINGPGQVFVERGGRMTPSDVKFASDQALRFLIETLLRPSGRAVDVASPYADARLPDGSRVNVVVPPVALDGPVVTIRKFTRSLGEVGDLIKAGTLTHRMASLLVAAVKSRLNILFAGATGTGKTTTLGILSKHIPEHERIVTIEDTAELTLKQKHVVRLECRPANAEGTGEVTLGHLLRNALRMRPSRIVVGEIRGDEAVEMLQSIASGHEGCLAVLHATSPSDAVSRLEGMVLSRGLQLPLWAIHRQIAAAIHLIVQHEMLLDGQRKITRITEVTGVESDHVALQNIFEFNDEGPDEHGRVKGAFTCTGVEPRFLSRFERYGISLPAGTFAAGPA